MEKEFSIVKVDGFLYVVDRTVKVLPDDWFFRTFCNDCEKMKNIDYGHFNPNDLRFPKVIASNNPSLTDLLQLPSVEQDVKDDVIKFLIENAQRWSAAAWDSNVGIYSDFAKDTESIIAKYKAAQYKQFTAEDMISAYDKGESSRYSRIGEAVLRKEFIQSLQLVPKAVVLEMEQYQLYIETDKLPMYESLPIELQQPHTNNPDNIFRPKIDSNNNVIVKQWIF